MKKTLLGLSSLLLVMSMYSCKEVPVMIDVEKREQSDTTYTESSVETAQTKNFLVEELSGVQCVNCPAGMNKLIEMSTTGEFKDRLIIASIHVGTFAWVIEGKSKQDFVVPGSDQLLEMVLGGDPGKPCASFDRLKMNNQFNYLIPNYNQWPANILSAKDSANTTPVNIHVTSTPGANEDEFDINVKLHYTEAVNDKQVLGIYLIENDIVDAMKYAVYTDTAYKFKHVLRKYVTPPTGKPILSDVSIAPGRVYEYKTKLTVDRNNAQEAKWNTDKMSVIVFVNSGKDGQRKIYHAVETHLKP